MGSPVLANGWRMRLALIVEYDGTNYHGFQYQSSCSSIQEELEKAISNLTKENIRVQGAGRTDAGVHAKGQVVAFNTMSEHSTGTFVRAVNHYLPSDIVISAAFIVHSGFDPRRDAVSRTYKYTILNNLTGSPLIRKTSFLVKESLDIEKMQEAARLLEGSHDFARFSGALSDRNASTVRHIYDAAIDKTGEIVSFEVTGNAFLPHQVRRMAGSLVQMGRGKLVIDKFRLMVEGENTGNMIQSLPPQGLCLLRVRYANDHVQD
jgi:tRNA pseudouridine38-40 synthase